MNITEGQREAVDQLRAAVAEIARGLADRTDPSEFRADLNELHASLENTAYAVRALLDHANAH